MKPLVVFDGECDFCAASLVWLKRLDWFHVFDSAPYQNKSLYTSHPTLSPDACEQAIHIIFPNQQIYSGSDALREIALRLPLLFWAGLLLMLPPIRQIAKKLYPLMARNRG